MTSGLPEFAGPVEFTKWLEFKEAKLVKRFADKAQTGKQFHYLEGYASDTSVDRDGDRMAPSALKSMLKGIEDGMNLFMDHEHGLANTLGIITKGEVRGNRLWLECRLEDPEVNPNVKSLINKMETGVKVGLSIGGDMLKHHFEEDTTINKRVRVIDDVALYEVSAVGLPSNANAFVYGSMFKSKKILDAEYKHQVRNELVGQIEKLLQGADAGQHPDQPGMAIHSHVHSHPPGQGHTEPLNHPHSHPVGTPHPAPVNHEGAIDMDDGSHAHEEPMAGAPLAGAAPMVQGTMGMGEEGGPGSGRHAQGRVGPATGHQLTTVPRATVPGDPLGPTTIPGLGEEDTHEHYAGEFPTQAKGGYAVKYNPTTRKHTVIAHPDGEMTLEQAQAEAADRQRRYGEEDVPFAARPGAAMGVKSFDALPDFVQKALIEIAKKNWISKPMGGYENFAACVRANKDKSSPDAYCGHIYHATHGKGFIFVDKKSKTVYVTKDWSGSSVDPNVSKPKDGHDWTYAESIDNWGDDSEDKPSEESGGEKDRDRYGTSTADQSNSTKPFDPNDVDGPEWLDLQLKVRGNISKSRPQGQSRGESGTTLNPHPHKGVSQ